MARRFDDFEPDVFEAYEKGQEKDVEDEDFCEETDEYDEDFSEEEFEDVSTMPVPTYSGKGEVDYVKVMEDYHSGNEKKREFAQETMAGELEGFIRSIIKKSYSSYTSKHYEDLVQCGRMGVVVAMQDYDPAKGQPSTYFHSFIVHEIQDYINKVVNKTTPYYSVNIKKIKKAINQFENLHLSYTAKDISIQTGIPLTTVERTLRTMNGNSEISLEFCGDKLEGPNFYDPVSTYLDKENTEFIYKTISEYLTQEEAVFVFYAHGLGDVEKLNLKQIALKMNISLDKVKKIKTSAHCKLRNSPLIQLRPDSYRNEVMELEDSDSVTFFPREQAFNSMKEMREIEIEF